MLEIYAYALYNASGNVLAAECLSHLRMELESDGLRPKSDFTMSRLRPEGTVIVCICADSGHSG